MVVINLCRDSLPVNNLIEKLFKESTVIDITGVVNRSPDILLRLSDIDPDGALERHSIEKYIDFIGELSNAKVNGMSVKSFTIYDRPIFWFTNLAEKHDSYHWGKDCWMLNSILEFRREYFSQKCRIILPGEFAHVASLIREFFKDKDLNEPEFSYIGKGGNAHRFSRFINNNLKALLRSFLHIKKIKKVSAVHKEKDLNIFFVNESPNFDISNDPDLGEAYILSSALTNSISIPYFNAQSLKKGSWNNLHNKFIFSAPTYYQLISLFVQQIRVFYRLNKFQFAHCRVNGLNVSFELLRMELLSGCRQNHFYNYLWLKNYRNKLEGRINFFFTNEFYISGRVISAALSSAGTDKIRTYGVQHGLLLKNHTVYRISPKETDVNQPYIMRLPSPDYFVVWGEYFKKLFLETRSFPDSYCLVGGNLKYMSIYAGTMQCNINSNTKSILWCTSLPVYFKAEYEIIEPALKKIKDYKLTFRLHPGGHIKEDEIKQWVDEDILNHSAFSNERSIFNDIAMNHIVISTWFSTTFFDTLILGKKSCRVITGIVKADFTNMRIENLYDIKKSSEFYNFFSEEKDQVVVNDAIGIESFFYMKKDVWQKILEND